jgi:hypothetical protein
MTTTRRNGIVLLIGLGLAGAGEAQTLTDAEFKCQAKLSKAATKFIAAKGACARRCVSEAARALHPWADCAPPFAGAMAECVAGPTGAEAKFEATIMNACDPSTRAGTDCPECYDGGDCGIGGEASDRMQNVEGQLDSVGAGIYCNVANGTAAERTCETNTAKALAKLTGAIGKCYDKCHASARRGPSSRAPAHRPRRMRLRPRACPSPTRRRSPASIGSARTWERFPIATRPTTIRPGARG